MTFADLVGGDLVFLDANTLVYHFTHHPLYGNPCTQLLQKIENQELLGFTSTHILTEAAHRIMTIEAIARHGLPIAGIAQRLRRHPSQVQQLQDFQQAVEQVLQSRIQVLSIEPALIASGAVQSRQTGLLSNDALLVAVMQKHHFVNLASNDADFDRVPGLTRYAPV